MTFSTTRTRAQAWSYYDTPLRVSPDVFSDIFKTIFNALEKQPDIKLRDMIDAILRTLEAR